MGRPSPRLAFVRARAAQDAGIWRRALARLTGEICGRCGELLDPGARVFRFSRRPEPLCSKCAPSPCPSELVLRGVVVRVPGARHSAEGPCETCGRGVVLVNDARRWRRHLFCSERCRWRYYGARISGRRAEAREKVCPCGHPFTKTRRDARFCSAACRQRAYRERRRSEGEP